MNNPTFYFLTIGVSIIAVMVVIAAMGKGKRKEIPASAGMTKKCPGLSKQEKKKQGNLEKIEKLLQSKSKITNNDVEKMLGVSDATAERYLNQLEKSGKLKQHGTSKKTYYTKK